MALRNDALESGAEASHSKTLARLPKSLVNVREKLERGTSALMRDAANFLPVGESEGIIFGCNPCKASWFGCRWRGARRWWRLGRGVFIWRFGRGARWRCWFICFARRS